MREYDDSIIWSTDTFSSIMSYEFSLFNSFKIEPFFHESEIRSFCLDNSIEIIALLIFHYLRNSFYITSCTEKIHDRFSCDLSTMRIVDRSTFYTESYFPNSIHIPITPTWVETIKPRYDSIYREISIPL